MSTIVTTAALGDWGASQALTHLFRGRLLWLALHNADPNGALPHEYAGGGYARQVIKFNAPVGHVITCRTAPTFHGLSAGTVRYLGVWTDVSAGSLVAVIDISSHPLITTVSGQVRAAVGDIAFSLPVAA